MARYSGVVASSTGRKTTLSNRLSYTGPTLTGMRAPGGGRFTPGSGSGKLPGQLRGRRVGR